MWEVRNFDVSLPFPERLAPELSLASTVAHYGFTIGNSRGRPGLLRQLAKVPIHAVMTACFRSSR
jgi:hypothetical protein